MGKGIAIASVVAVALSLPFFGYRWNLFMHIFGAMLFMGNIFVSAVWFSLAKRTGDAVAVRFAAEGVAKTDVIFTTPGAIMLLLNGGILGTRFFKAGDSWIMLALGLFVVSGIIWLAVLVPAQRRMLAATQHTPALDTLERDMKLWFRAGGMANLLAIVTLVLMVVKPKLW